MWASINVFHGAPIEILSYIQSEQAWANRNESAWIWICPPRWLPFGWRTAGFEFHSYSRTCEPIGSRPLARYANLNYEIKRRPSSNGSSRITACGSENGGRRSYAKWNSADLNTQRKQVPEWAGKSVKQTPPFLPFLFSLSSLSCAE